MTHQSSEISLAPIMADGQQPAASTGSADNADEPSLESANFDETVQSTLSARLNSIGESADPVAELDEAVEAAADELGRRWRAGEDSPPAAGSPEEIDGAIQALVSVALEMDDPVAALEEGADSLAQALVERDAAAQAWLETAREQQIDEQAACRHARLHRVSELMDVGYGFDEAIAITNGNEADIRARALAMGRNPMEPIYEYAVRNGYQGTRPAKTASPADRDRASPIAALAQLSDEAFAEATKGDRWQRLMRL